LGWRTYCRNLGGLRALTVRRSVGGLFPGLLQCSAVDAQLVVVSTFPTDEGVYTAFHDLLNISADPTVFDRAAVFDDSSIDNALTES
jgi:hypothetical protein